MNEEGTHDETEAVVEVEFRLTDDRHPLVGVPKTADCRIVMEKLLPRDEQRFAQYYSVVGADAQGVQETLGSFDDVESRLLVPYDSGGLFEVLVTPTCPVCDLARRGAVPTTVEGTTDGGTIVAEIFPADDDPGELLSRFLEEYSAELAAKRRKVEATPLVSEREVRDTVLDRLTDRQREVLFAAFDAGYYERPRKTTGTELADELGITSATFQQHLRAAERKLVSLVAEYGSE